MSNLHNRQPEITLSQADIDHLLESNNITFVRIELRHMMNDAKEKLRKAIESESATATDSWGFLD